MRAISSLLIAVAIILFACNEHSGQTSLRESNVLINKLTPTQIAEGWELLYDGESKKGWHIYLNKTDGSAWKSEDGVLFLDAQETEGWQTKNGGDLVSDSVYEDFHLCFDWMVDSRGNSGVLFFVQEDTAFDFSIFSGLKMQLLDNNGNVQGRIITRRAGDLLGLLSAKREPVNPAGRWNSSDIRVENGNLDMFMNGKKIISTRIDDKAWEDLINQSEFKNFPGFGRYKSGHIALQDHGTPVWFRNIRIRKL